jgi:uncharacterized membrane protein
MGPIVEAGFALGIYDFSLLKKSLRNLFNATLVGLAVSTLYFYLSRCTIWTAGQNSSQYLWYPNCFFLRHSRCYSSHKIRKRKSYTRCRNCYALMPPLCTAGYGIATAQWNFFLGAFYLYCINCVFIGIATFLIIKYLDYPAVKQIDEKHQKRIKYIIVLLITIMLLPSSYLAYSLYREQQSA